MTLGWDMATPPFRLDVVTDLDGAESGVRLPERLRMSQRLATYVVTALVVVLVAACAPATLAPMPKELAVSRADYGDAWPLTVESGVIHCGVGRAVLFRAPDGTEYAVNGFAMDGSYADLDPIWAADPTGISPKLSIGPLIEAGLALCG